MVITIKSCMVALATMVYYTHIHSIAILSSVVDVGKSSVFNKGEGCRVFSKRLYVDLDSIGCNIYVHFVQNMFVPSIFMAYKIDCSTRVFRSFA